jgi:hypothetical protein
MVRRVFARVAGLCGLLALVTSTVGWAAGGLAQPGSYSPARDDISDLGAVTANGAWIYNQVGANLTGVLVAVLAVGLWRALSPDLLGRLGAAALLVAVVGSFLDGLFRLDCCGIDAACTNDSWHSHAHKLESGGRDPAHPACPCFRVSPDSELAPRVAAEPGRASRDPACECGLLRDWRRGRDASGNRGLLRLGCLRRRLAAARVL